MKVKIGMTLWRTRVWGGERGTRGEERRGRGQLKRKISQKNHTIQGPQPSIIVIVVILITTATTSIASKIRGLGGWAGLTGKRVAAEVRRRRAWWWVWGLAESLIH